MSSLHAKLSLVLLALVTVLGGMFFVVERWSTTLYHEELTQRLNAPIAMYVVGEQQLISAGVVDRPAVEALAHQAMIINPTVEIYLLDADGRIIDHAVPKESVSVDRVDLEPVYRVLAGDGRMPVHGDDPRSPDDRKVFSVAEVRDGERLEGYVYAVLGGAQYEALADDMNASYVTRTSVVAIGALAACVFVAGALLFAFLTRRLRRLTSDVQAFTQSGFDPAQRFLAKPRSGDEIDSLGCAFEKMSERIIEQFEQLKESDRLRRELVTNVSHDLRTPLATMQGYIETLIIKGDSLDGAEQAQYLEIARKHSVRLGQLISELFELSKLESGTVAPNLESFSLAELMHDVVQEFQLVAEQQRVTLAVEQPDRPLMVVADISLIQRVLENLLKNALRFTPEGGEITMRLSRLPASVGVSVVDTGRGIPEADLPRIFDRFYRSEQGREAESTSSGLGLSIVKRILDLHDSRITVTSKLDAGTRFDFELPAEALAA